MVYAYARLVSKMLNKQWYTPSYCLDHESVLSRCINSILVWTRSWLHPVLELVWLGNGSDSAAAAAAITVYARLVPP